jgi:kynurenine formamidase
VAVRRAEIGVDVSATDNWGRWGEEDERGCLNLVDAAAVLRGAASVRRGEVIELGHVIGSARSPVLEGRRATTQHFMLRDGGDPEEGGPGALQHAEDALSIYVHATTTHIDGLGHGWADGRLYNGFPAAEVNSRGARRCGVEKMGGIVTRGVLLDVPALHGKTALEIDHEISAEEMEGAAEAAGGVEPGDAVLVRTGWMADAERRPNDLPLEHPGIGASAVDWLADNDIALTGADTIAYERVPAADGSFSPLHVRLLRELGLPIMELLDLERLAAGRHTQFCLMVSPLRIQGGTGSPVCPLAIV